MSCTRGCCASQADHYRSVVVRMPSPQQQAARAEVADMDAYARLRKDGVQPKQIAGAAKLEREADSVHEVQQGMLVKNARLRRELDAAHATAPPLDVA